MKRKSLMMLTLILVLLSFAALGTLAQEGDEPEPAPLEDQTAAPNVMLANVRGAFTYQGYLEQNGAPVNGSCDFDVRLFDTAVAGSQVGVSDIDLNQTVDNGRFTLTLNDNDEYGANAFDGQERWLEVLVRCPAGSGSYTTLNPRQTVTAAPYALSLQAGASIQGDNTALTVSSNTIAQEAALVGFATASSGPNQGLMGKTNSPDGTGVYALGKGTGADLILGGEANTSTGDDGRITSDPSYPSSDIWLQSNDGIVLALDTDGDGEDAHVVVYDKDDRTLFDIDESGSVNITTNAGSTGNVVTGQRYRDNAIIAWARVSAAGEIDTNSFGVQSVTVQGQGRYFIDLTAAASGGGLSLIPMAIAEVENAPVGAANVRLVSVDQQASDFFIVYINDGTFNLVNNDFVFMVTGR